MQNPFFIFSDWKQSALRDFILEWLWHAMSWLPVTRAAYKMSSRQIFSVTLAPLLFYSHRHPSSLQFYCCVPTVIPASSCSSFETTHFAVCTCLIWKVLNHPETSLTRQTLKHGLCLNLCWQAPRETYNKFTQMKTRSPHCTLPLNHCIPPFPVLQMHRYWILSLHYILAIFL